MQTGVNIDPSLPVKFKIFYPFLNQFMAFATYLVKKSVLLRRAKLIIKADLSLNLSCHFDNLNICSGR